MWLISLAHSPRIRIVDDLHVPMRIVERLFYSTVFRGCCEVPRFPIRYWDTLLRRLIAANAEGKWSKQNVITESRTLCHQGLRHYFLWLFLFDLRLAKFWFVLVLGSEGLALSWRRLIRQLRVVLTLIIFFIISIVVYAHFLIVGWVGEPVLCGRLAAPVNFGWNATFHHVVRGGAPKMIIDRGWVAVADVSDELIVMILESRERYDVHLSLLCRVTVIYCAGVPFFEVAAFLHDNIFSIAFLLLNLNLLRRCLDWWFLLVRVLSERLRLDLANRDWSILYEGIVRVHYLGVKVRALSLLVMLGDWIVIAHIRRLVNCVPFHWSFAFLYGLVRRLLQISEFVLIAFETVFEYTIIDDSATAMLLQTIFSRTFPIFVSSLCRFRDLESSMDGASWWHYSAIIVHVPLATTWQRRIRLCHVIIGCCWREWRVIGRGWNAVNGILNCQGTRGLHSNFHMYRLALILHLWTIKHNQIKQVLMLEVQLVFQKLQVLVIHCFDLLCYGMIPLSESSRIPRLIIYLLCFLPFLFFQ